MKKANKFEAYTSDALTEKSPFGRWSIGYQRLPIYTPKAKHGN